MEWNEIAAHSLNPIILKKSQLIWVIHIYARVVLISSNIFHFQD